MKHIERAIDELRRTEDALRAVMSDALAEQAYREVAAVAAIADAIAGLVRSKASLAEDVAPYLAGRPTPSPRQEVSPQDTKQIPSMVNKPAAKVSGEPSHLEVSVSRSRKSSKQNDYPRFEREADRLVKIGWSKRDRRAYEHRAPRDVVFRFARLLEAKTSNDTFTMDDLLPIKDENGSELPSYQAYLAMAWLRSLGAIQRVGKNGYSVKPENLTPDALEHFWDLLTARQPQPS
jgi:hypothetical protein